MGNRIPEQLVPASLLTIQELCELARFMPGIVRAIFGEGTEYTEARVICEMARQLSTITVNVIHDEFHEDLESWDNLRDFLITRIKNRLYEMKWTYEGTRVCGAVSDVLECISGVGERMPSYDGTIERSRIGSVIDKLRRDPHLQKMIWVLEEELDFRPLITAQTRFEIMLKETVALESGALHYCDLWSLRQAIAGALFIVCRRCVSSKEVHDNPASVAAKALRLGLERLRLSIARRTMGLISEEAALEIGVFDYWIGMEK